MRGARGVLEGMPLEQAEVFCTQMSAYMLQKSLEMGNFGTNSAATGGVGGCGGGDRGGVQEKSRKACRQLTSPSWA